MIFRSLPIRKFNYRRIITTITTTTTTTTTTTKTTITISGRI